MEDFDFYIVTGNFGTGKTTTSRKISETFAVPWEEPDEMRRKMGLREYDPQDTPGVMKAIWESIEEALLNNKPIIFCSQYVRRRARLQLFATIKDIGDHLGKAIQTVLIHCVCPENLAKERIVSRKESKDGELHLPTSNPRAYDRIKKMEEPIGQDEIEYNPDISFVILDTEKNAVIPLAIRAHHKVAIDRLIEAIVEG